MAEEPPRIEEISMLLDGDMEAHIDRAPFIEAETTSTQSFNHDVNGVDVNVRRGMNNRSQSMAVLPGTGNNDFTHWEW